MNATDKSRHADKAAADREQDGVPSFLNYPPSEDIYIQGDKESEVDPEDITKKKENLPTQIEEKHNQKNFRTDVSGSDLDVPGGELDDEQEATGNEDEENNYYSIGGDNHNNLEDDNG